MKAANITLCLFGTSILAAVVPAEPATRNALDKRVEMTYVQNWFLAGGAAMAAVGTLASGIAAIISATSTASSCTLVEDTVETRSVHASSSTTARNITAVIENLTGHGFDTNLTAWTVNPDTGVLYHEGAMHSSEVETSLSDITITESLVNATVIANKASNSSSFDTRSTILTDRIHIEFHVTGQCYTIRSESDIYTGVYGALAYTSYYEELVGCWAVGFGGPWKGHLKFLDLYTGNTVSAIGYDKACAGSI